MGLPGMYSQAEVLLARAGILDIPEERDYEETVVAASVSAAGATATTTTSRVTALSAPDTAVGRALAVAAEDARRVLVSEGAAVLRVRAHLSQHSRYQRPYLSHPRDQ